MISFPVIESAAYKKATLGNFTSTLTYIEIVEFGVTSIIAYVPGVLIGLEETITAPLDSRISVLW